MTDPGGARATGDGGRRERALGALAGLAIGDALGMPTQMMSRAEVRRRFGKITGFLAAAPDHPIAAGMAAGSVTDDTEQALLVARLLVSGHGRVDPAVLAGELVAWESRMRDRGSLDLLGPSTRAAVAAVLAGEPVDRAGRRGTTNGAAMRITPVGIANSCGDLDALVDAVVAVSMVSHNTGVALAGAAAVAGAVSAGVEGLEAVETALAASRLAGTRGYWVAAADVPRRIEWALSLADPRHPERSLTDLAELVGTSLATQESVPTAFGIVAAFPDDPWAAVCAAAGLGGDTDTVAAMVGAMAGARHGVGAFPEAAVAEVEAVNHLGVASVADELLELR